MVNGGSGWRNEPYLAGRTLHVARRSPYARAGEGRDETVVMFAVAVCVLARVAHQGHGRSPSPPTNQPTMFQNRPASRAGSRSGRQGRAEAERNSLPGPGGELKEEKPWSISNSKRSRPWTLAGSASTHERSLRDKTAPASKPPQYRRLLNALSASATATARRLFSRS